MMAAASVYKYAPRMLLILWSFPCEKSGYILSYLTHSKVSEIAAIAYEVDVSRDRNLWYMDDCLLHYIL